MFTYNSTLRYPSQFREIAVDPQLQTSDGTIYDIMFVGTDKGQVLKIVNSANKVASDAESSDFAPVLVEELQVLKSGAPILSMFISRETETSERRLVVVAGDEVCC